MEQAKKQLKISSLFVLLFAGMSFIQIIVELVFGEINSATIPEGAPDNILQITKMFLLGITIILLIPEFYVGIKGFLIVKNPTSSQRHIILAMIILVFDAIGFINPILNMVNQGNIYDNLVIVANVSLEVILMYEYIKYAKAVSKLAE